jgi:hypothetical protein
MKGMSMNTKFTIDGLSYYLYLIALENNNNVSSAVIITELWNYGLVEGPTELRERERVACPCLFYYFMAS